MCVCVCERERERERGGEMGLNSSDFFGGSAFSLFRNPKTNYLSPNIFEIYAAIFTFLHLSKEY